MVYHAFSGTAAGAGVIAIIDYGMGNLASVEKAFSFLGARAHVTADPHRLARAQALVFPGVGAFGEAMRELRKRRLVAPIVGSIQEGKPFLGLCLGLQLLFESSDESPGAKGLGVLRGRVRRLPSLKNLKVPHMGWNQIEKLSDDRLLEGVPDGGFMYFVHSFYAEPHDRETIRATTRYAVNFASVVSDGRRLWATQFHPEKSQRGGLRILKNFIQQAASC